MWFVFAVSRCSLFLLHILSTFPLLCFDEFPFLLWPHFFAHVSKCVITFSHSNFFLFFIRCLWTWDADKALWWVRFCDKWHGNLPSSWGGWNKTGFDVCLGGDGLKTKYLILPRWPAGDKTIQHNIIYILQQDQLGSSWWQSPPVTLSFLHKANVMNWRYTLTCFTNRVAFVRELQAEGANSFFLIIRYYIYIVIEQKVYL